MVVIAVLDMVSAEDLDLAYVGILLPLRGSDRSARVRRTHSKKVDFFEQFLFVVFEFADHFCGRRARGRGWELWTAQVSGLPSTCSSSLTYLSPQKLSQYHIFPLLFFSFIPRCPLPFTPSSPPARPICVVTAPPRRLALPCPARPPPIPHAPPPPPCSSRPRLPPVFFVPLRPAPGHECSCSPRPASLPAEHPPALPGPHQSPPLSPLPAAASPAAAARKPHRPHVQRSNPLHGHARIQRSEQQLVPPIRGEVSDASERNAAGSEPTDERIRTAPRRIPYGPART